MDEDEEVVFKNTGLYDHLLDAGYKDFETFEEKKPFPSVPDSEKDANVPANVINIQINAEELDEFMNQVNMFLNSKLVFDDDVLFVKNFISCFKCVSSRSPIRFYKEYFLFSAYHICNLFFKMATVTTMCSIWSICGLKIRPLTFISLHMLPVGWHCVTYSYTKYGKNKRKKCSEILLKNLKDLSLLIQKSIQFVHECEVVSFREKPVPCEIKLLMSNVDEWKTMYYLRRTIFLTMRSIILKLKDLIISLCRTFQLKKTVDLLSHYLAFLDEADLKCTDTVGSTTVAYLQKMKYVYLLLQSEFLRRLSLCFIPTLWIYDTRVLIQTLFESLNTFSEECRTSHNTLKSVFEMYYTYEKPEPFDCPSLKNDKKWIYRETYLKLSSLSFNMQSVLRESRCLEEFLENTRFQDADYETVVKFLDTNSEEIVKNYNNCKTVVDDFRKYIISLKPKLPDSNIFPVSASKPSEDAHVTNITLGHTDFTPNWPDEVYIGISDSKIHEMEAADSTNVEKNPSAKLLINELKVKLEDKAKEWKERERVALKNKNIEDINDLEETETEHDGDGEITSKFQEKDSNFTTHVSLSEFRPTTTSESLFTEQIATASASWSLKTEEYFAESDNSE